MSEVGGFQTRIIPNPQHVDTPNQHRKKRRFPHPNLAVWNCLPIHNIRMLRGCCELGQLALCWRERGLSPIRSTLAAKAALEGEEPISSQLGSVKTSFNPWDSDSAGPLRVGTTRAPLASIHFCAASSGPRVCAKMSAWRMKPRSLGWEPSTLASPSSPKRCSPGM